MTSRRAQLAELAAELDALEPVQLKVHGDDVHITVSDRFPALIIPRAAVLEALPKSSDIS